MSEKILNEILTNVKQTNEKLDCLEGRVDGLEGKIDELEENVDGLETKFDAKLKNTEENLRMEIRMKSELIIKKLSKDGAEHTHEVLDSVERLRDEKINQEIAKHEEKTMKGLEAFKKVLAS